MNGIESTWICGVAPDCRSTEATVGSKKNEKYFMQLFLRKKYFWNKVNQKKKKKKKTKQKQTKNKNKPKTKIKYQLESQGSNVCTRVRFFLSRKPRLFEIIWHMTWRLWHHMTWRMTLFCIMEETSVLSYMFAFKMEILVKSG